MKGGHIVAVFRIEKTKDYTVMSNHHLRNKALSLKAKGLLSQMLSLPEDWDYTLKGLSFINRENIDAIRTAVQELERAGYITRTRERNSKGQLGGTEYVIHEQPPDGFAPDGGAAALPDCERPTQEKPTLENPTQDDPTLESPTQLNIDRRITEESNTESSITDSIPFPSPRGREQESKRNGMEAVDVFRNIIKGNIGYDTLIKHHRTARERIDEMLDLIAETVCTARKTVRIASDDHPTGLVKSKFMKLTHRHIEFVLDCMENNTSEIRNIKKYMLAALFNAPSTIDSYYTALVAHDVASGRI
jgi:hypothetical protein